ncbi:MAG: hypothetical protein V1886_01845 [archaeon]
MVTETLEKRVESSNNNHRKNGKKKVHPHDILTSKKKSRDLKFLYLAEMGFGTKVYDSRAMDGLVFWMQKNGYKDKINSVIIQGGLVPHIPFFYSRGNAQDMRFLGKDPNKEDDKGFLVDKTKLSGDNQEFYKDYISKKINLTSEATDFAKREIDKLATVAGNASLHYQYGEEDYKNIENQKEVKINEYVQTEENEKRLNEYLEKFKETSSVLETQRDRLIRKKESSKKLKQVEKEIAGMTGKIRDIEQKINAIQREKEASQFFNITKRKEMTAEQEEIAFHLSKKEYQSASLDVIFSSFDKFQTHSTSEKFVNFSYRGKDRTIKDIYSFGKEQEQIKATDLTFLLVHNPNSIRSDNVSADSIKKLRLESNFLNRLSDELKMPVPDVILTAHGTGGLRCFVEGKYSEKTNGERLTPEPNYLFKLPTFQSTELLQVCKSKGIKNWHTKRFSEKNYASGAMIQTFSDTEAPIIEYLEMPDLIRFGEIKKEIDKKRKLLKKAKENRREHIKEEIRNLESLVKINPDKRLSIEGDFELGVDNHPGRPSNYEFIDAAQKYQRKKGLPDVLLLSEHLHDDMDSYYIMAKHNLALVPKEIEEKMEEIKNDKSLTPKNRINLLERLVLEKFIYTSPIQPTDKIIREWKLRVLPYVLECLDNGGRTVIVSGNHYNNQRNGREEAILLGSLIPEQYNRDNQVEIVSSPGDEFGSGAFELDGHTIYTSHKMWAGHDEMERAMTQVLRMNKKADAVIYFHKHHGGIGFADGTSYTEGFGMQPWNNYVDRCGKTPGLRGVINYYPDFEKGYHKWEIIVDPILEKLMPKRLAVLEKSHKE